MKIGLTGYGHETISIEVEDYAYPHAEDYWDGNWLACTVEARLPGFAAEYRTAVRSDELAAFLATLERFADSPDERARLENMDDTIELSLQAGPAGKLTCAGSFTCARSGRAKLAFAFPSDPALLPGLIRQVGDVLAAFPVRGLAGSGFTR